MKHNFKLERSEAAYFRDQLRAGRAEALRDAEGSHQILYAIERLGLRCCRKVQSLGKYKESLTGLSASSALSTTVPERWPQWHISFVTLFEELRRARNDALHQGAYARTLTSNALQLALVLEDALMNEAKTVAEFMVRDVAVAEPWQPVSFVRQQMLAQSYSYLPLALERKGGERWHLVSDYAVATFL